MKKQFLVSSLAASLLLTPVMAMADGIVKLAPLSPTTTSSLTPQRDESVPLRGRISTIPKGTTMMVKVDQPISSFTSNLGDPISATLENDIYLNDTVIVPSGSEVLGQVVNVSRSGRLGKHGEIEARFVSVKTPDGVVLPIRAHIVTSDETGILKGNSYGHDVLRGVGITAGSTLAGAALGTASGSLLGSVGQGALFGTAVGGIAGVSYAMMRQGKDVVIPSGARFSIVVDQPVTVNP